VANRPLTAVFAALEQMGYRAVARQFGMVAYLKTESGVTPQAAIFDATSGSIEDERLIEALEASGIDYGAVCAMLDGISPSV
jgi:hypothetical protein